MYARATATAASIFSLCDEECRWLGQSPSMISIEAKQQVHIAYLCNVGRSKAAKHTHTHTELHGRRFANELHTHIPQIHFMLWVVERVKPSSVDRGSEWERMTISLFGWTGRWLCVCAETAETSHSCVHLTATISIDSWWSYVQVRHRIANSQKWLCSVRNIIAK